jgi:hypothetical protein
VVHPISPNRRGDNVVFRQTVLPYRSLTTKPPELRFHALLSDGVREVRFERVVGG